MLERQIKNIIVQHPKTPNLSRPQNERGRGNWEPEKKPNKLGGKNLGFKMETRKGFLIGHFA